MAVDINGINIAVRDLAAATEKYERLFGVTGEHVSGSAFAFPGLVGTRLDIDGFILNLISSEDPSTSVSKFLERNGEGVFLLSVKTDDIEAGSAELREQGLNPLFEQPLRGEYGAVTFLHPKELNGVQLELIEHP